MKVRTAIGTILVLVLVAMVSICWVSTRMPEAANDRSIFEQCEEPVTFRRVLSLAVFGNRSSANACLNNLRQIDGAKQQWALENKKNSGDQPTWNDISPCLGRGTPGHFRLWCPNGGVYRLNSVSNAPTCSIPNHKLL